MGAVTLFLPQTFFLFCNHFYFSIMVRTTIIACIDNNWDFQNDKITVTNTKQQKKEQKSKF